MQPRASVCSHLLVLRRGAPGRGWKGQAGPSLQGPAWGSLQPSIWGARLRQLRGELAAAVCTCVRRLTHHKPLWLTNVCETLMM